MASGPDGTLRALLEAAARGEPPPADGAVRTLPAPPGPAMAILAFTAHHVVASSAPEAWVRAELRGGDLQAPMSARFVSALADRVGARPDSHDVVLAATGLGGEPALTECARDAHPRVQRAQAHREDVRVFEAAGGHAVVILGRGLAGRAEVAVEVDADHRGRGLARAALVEARRLAAPGEALFAQTAPGNAASLRALLAAGFRPIGGEVLLLR
jgi:GNAT superfamily N-acetyltransferase